jgi:hypothetical protein
MSQTAMAQIPEQCKGLQNVKDYKWEPNNVGNLALSVLVHNEGPYDVIFCVIFF